MSTKVRSALGSPAPGGPILRPRLTLAAAVVSIAALSALSPGHAWAQG